MLEIKKLGNSHHPWRLLKDGVEVAIPVIFDHPDIGETVVTESISGNTKAECLQRVLDVLETLMEPQLEPLKRIPTGVQETIKISINSVKGWNTKVENARTTDRLFNGFGRYTFEATNGIQMKEPDNIRMFREICIDKGINPKYALKALGYEEPLRLTPEELSQS